jgi:hypothetical protein
MLFSAPDSRSTTTAASAAANASRASHRWPRLTGGDASGGAPIPPGWPSLRAGRPSALCTIAVSFPLALADDIAAKPAFR